MLNIQLDTFTTSLISDLHIFVCSVACSSTSTQAQYLSIPNKNVRECFKDEQKSF